MQFLRTFVVSFFLIQIGWSHLTAVFQGNGFIGKQSQNRKECEIVKIYFERSDPIEATENGTHSRLIIFSGSNEITTTGSTAAESYLYLKSVIEKSEKFNGKLETKDVLKLFDLLENGKWVYTKQPAVTNKGWEIITSQFHLNPLEDKIQEIREVMLNPNNYFLKCKILKNMGFDLELEKDMIYFLNFTMTFEKLSNFFELNVCDQQNPSRKYGKVYMIAPIGNFIEGSHVYKYFDMPQYAVEISNRLESAESCEKRGNLFGCQLQESNCTIMNYRNCPTLLKMTPNKVFAFEMGQATYISTTEKYFEMFSKNTTGGQLYKFPKTGHMLFQAPYDHFIRFPTLPVQDYYGKYDGEVVMKAVHDWEGISKINHGEIYEHKETTGNRLSDEDWKELHEKHGHHFNWDTLVHLFKSQTIIMILIIVIFCFVIICILFFAYDYVRLRRRNQNFRAPIDIELIEQRWSGYEQSTDTTISNFLN